MAFDFPNAPTTGQVFNNYTWDGEKWAVTSIYNPVDAGAVRFDKAQALTPAQTSQARSNIDVTKKNYILNGAMQVSQEFGTTAGSGVNGYYAADQFCNYAAGSPSVYSVALVASPTPGGSSNRFRMTVTTADAAVAATDIVWIETRMEGIRVADLRYGTASAKTTTLRFGCRGPAGTYSLAVNNATTNRSYVAEYVLAASTDTVVSLVIPGDVTGTWATDNTVGIQIRWALMVGTTYQLAAGSWTAFNAVGSPNQFNFMATVGNIFELFDVSLTEGTVAPPFQVPHFADELRACQRYFEGVGAGLIGVVRDGASVNVAGQYTVLKRTTATVTSITNPQIWTPAGYFTGVGSVTAPYAAYDSLGFTMTVNGFTGLTTGSFVVSNQSGWFKINARL